jgi:hypothetical protein
VRTIKKYAAIASLVLVVSSCAGDQGLAPTHFTPRKDLFDSLPPKRLIVIKDVNGYGDFEKRDAALIAGLCLKKYKGSIMQEQFGKDYSDRNVRLVSGPPIEYSVHAEVDERFTATEEYVDQVVVPSYIDGVVMNDGKTIAVKKQRAVVKGRLRNIYGQCTAFEYHF